MGLRWLHFEQRLSKVVGDLNNCIFLYFQAKVSLSLHAPKIFSSFNIARIGRAAHVPTPETANLAINMKSVGIKNIWSDYFGGNTSWLRKLEYDADRLI